MSTSNATPECPPAFWLEAACSGEPVRGEVQAHLASCEKCGAELSRLRRERDAYQAAHPPAVFRRKVMARAPEAAPPRRWGWAFGLAPVAATALALGTVVLPAASVQLKGAGAAFQVFYKRKGEPQVFVPGNHLRVGDALRFSYTAPGNGYLMVLDVDGGGRIQTFYPYGAAEAVPVHPKDPPLLRGSIALDGSPGPEHLFAVYRPTPFTFDAISRELQTVGTSGPRIHCEDCRVEEIQIEKEP
jgi:hypothetical protein